MKTTKKTNAFRCSSLTRAVLGAIAVVGASSAVADPLLTVKIFRDSDVIFRDADMARYAESYVEVGAGYNSSDSFKFGQWSGLTEQGAFAIVGFNWLSRNEAEDARYARFYGSSLGLPSRKLQVETGHQGRWNVSASADSLKRSELDDAYFIHTGLGTENLSASYLGNSLATVASTTSTSPSTVSANNAAIAPRLKQYDIVQTRDIYRLGMNSQISDQWDLRVNFREDRRDGTRLTGMAFSAGAAMIVPYPHQDHTQQVDLMASYTTKDVQFQAGYAYSRYENEHDALNASNPFVNPLCAPGTTTTSTAYLCGPILTTATLGQVISSGADQGRMSLSPDNEFHQLLVNAAYNLNKQTRFTAQATYGVATQDQAYLPYTANPGHAGQANAGLNTVNSLNASSLDGKMIYKTADLAAILRPIDKMSAKVSYQFRENDNQTPVQRVEYVGRDGTTRCTPLASPTATSTSCYRQNAPMSTREHRFAVDGDYEIFDRTVMRLGAENHIRKYTLADREETTTRKAFAEVRRPVSDEFLGSAAVIRSQRRGSEYNKNVYFENTYYVSGLKVNGGTPLTNHPSTRPYMFNDYDENRGRLSGSWAATETVSLQAVMDAYRQESKKTNCATVYDPDIIGTGTGGINGTLPDVCLGRTELQGGSLALDLQWQPEENLTTFAFANVAQTKTGQRGRSWSRGTATAGTNGATAPDWLADLTYSDRAVGFGLKWQPIEKWDLGSTYVFASSNEKIELAMSNNAAVTQYPETNSRMHTLQLFAKWDYSKALTWRFNYVYEMLRYSDWQVDNANAGSNAGVLFTGQNAPNYINHVFGVSVAIKTW